MSSEKKEKKSKRDKSEHKSKKRQLDLESQPEEERQHKRSKSEAPVDHSNDASVKVNESNTEHAAAVDNAGFAGKAARSERRKEKKRQSQGGGGIGIAAGVSMTDGATANGIADEKALDVAEVEAVADKKRKKDNRKHRDQKSTGETEEPATNQEQEADEAVTASPEKHDEERKRRRKEKKEKRRKEQETASASVPDVAAQPHTTEDDDDAMDIDSSSAKTSQQPFGKLPNQPYPFFTQQVSQYLPLYPLGMIEPLDGYADQHLKPLLNHYVPTFEGVLLGYHDVQIGEAPGRGSITEKSENSDEAVLESIDEYAVAFGWLTAKLDLFKPSRGAWMEGSVNMQTEGHLGVVCWGMFNAAIEAGRLPEGWRWVSLLGSSKQNGKGREKTPEEAKLPTPEPVEGDAEDVTQLHTTGYWVDQEGQPIRGNIRFQIKNFEVGVSGDYGYLSIEGTMLGEAAEKNKCAEEMEKIRRWKLKNSASRKEHRRLPDFSMTKFGMDEDQEDARSALQEVEGKPTSE